MLQEPPLTEPRIVNCLWITGRGIEWDGAVRIVGWTLCPRMGGETEERRIVLRAAMDMRTARKLAHDLRERARNEH